MLLQCGRVNAGDHARKKSRGGVGRGANRSDPFSFAGPKGRSGFEKPNREHPDESSRPTSATDFLYPDSSGSSPRMTVERLTHAQSHCPVSGRKRGGEGKRV